MSTIVRISLACAGAALLAATACGSDVTHNPNYGSPPDAGWNPGPPGPGDGYGSGNNAGGTDGGSFDAAPPPPMCPDALKLCAETFTYPYNGETSVELRGDYRAGAWTMGDPMTHIGQRVDGDRLRAVGSAGPVQVLRQRDDLGGRPQQPAARRTTPTNPDGNSIDPPITCPSTFTCATPAVPPAGVFDWRDAVIYFVFVDRFLDGDPANNCNVPGTQPERPTPRRTTSAATGRA